MAKKKLVGLTEESFGRVRQAVRKSEKQKRVGSARRRQKSPVVGSRPFLAKANANIATRTSGSLSVYNGPLGSEADSTKDITAFNLSDQQADSGTWVLVFRMSGGYGFVPLECPA